MSKTAILQQNSVTGKYEASYHGRVIVKGNSKDYVINMIRGGISNKAKALGITDVQEIGNQQATFADAKPVSAVVDINSEFSINERFMILSDYVDMVARGQLPSALITGEGGLGKTHTVMKSLRENGLTDISKMDVETRLSPSVKGFISVKGNSTAKGLFRTLYENRSKIVVFDDCDSVLRDPVAVNLLKAALDSYDERVITWNSEGADSDLPRSFEFTGGVIFISNMSVDKIPQAIKSRAMCADVSMTRSEVVERMRMISSGADFMPNFDEVAKSEAMEFVAENAYHPLVRSLNLRSLMNVIKCRASKPETWRRLALYDMANT